MPRRSFPTLLKDEFYGYSLDKLRQDTLAGITVAAVALPLALAFGVASGATAAAGLVTAILGGIIIGGLSGAPYQISGPTGAMSAVLLVLAGQYGMQGVWVAGALAGLFLLVIGLLKLGRFIAFIPAPVITGFTAGIALIIAIGQIDSFLGVSTPATDSAAMKVVGYLEGVSPDWHAMTIGGLVAALMIVWPRSWNARFPASLLGIAGATAFNALVQWPVEVIGEIPRTLLLEDRLGLGTFPLADLGPFIAPALSITALSAVESLLCGAVASNMTGIRLMANQELIAQGVGNMLIPFLGGVPATAAIARTSVGIRSGGQTRMVSIIHATALLGSMFMLAPVMGRIPLAALAGVLIVTAWRMNEWEDIRYIFGHRFKTAIITFGITLAATIALDLTQAILIGAALSAALFLNDSASIHIDVQSVDIEKLRRAGIQASGGCASARIAHLTGPLFFAATGNFNEAFARLQGTHVLILSMRGVPLIDTSGLQVLAHLATRMKREGGILMLAGIHSGVMKMLERGGLIDLIGPDNFASSADQAIVAAEARGCAACHSREERG